MKAATVVFVVVGALFCANADLTDEQKEKLRTHGKECVSETGVDTELVKNARLGTFAEDAKLKSFSLCLAKKSGFQNDAGEVQKDVIKQKLGAALGNPDTASELVEKCLVVKDNAEDTAFDSFKCYYENTPTHLTVF